MTVDEINIAYSDALNALDERLVESQTYLELEYQRERNALVKFYEDLRHQAIEKN